MLWLWIACSVKIPDYLLDPYGVAHPQCSESDHLRAVGFDEESSVVAQQNARRRLAESISSSLQSVQVSKTNVEQIDGTETSSSEYEAVSTVTAMFSYNHLIRDVEPVHRSREGYRALACVRVSEIEQAIRLKHQEVLQGLETTHQSLMNTQDVGAFSSMRMTYLESLQPMLADFDLLRSLTEGNSLWGNTLYVKQQQVEQRAQEFRRANPVAIVSNETNEQANALGALLQASQVSVHQGDCTSAEGYRVHLQPETNVGKGPMGGYVATYSIHMSISTCDDPVSSIFGTEIVQSQGYHSSKQSLAESSAVENAVLSEIPEVFSTLLPLP